MVNCFIRNFSVFTTSFYIFFKLLNIKTIKKHTPFLLLSIGMAVCLFVSYLFTNNQSLNWICILLSLFFIMKFITQVNFSITYITVLFSFSLSFISFCASSFIVALFLSLFYYDNYALPILILRIITMILHFLLVNACFRIPRLQKGMKFLYHIPSTNMGSTLCIFLIMLITILYKAKLTMRPFTSEFTTLIILIGLLLFYWWNYHITQTYRRFLRRNELDSLNLLLEERNQQILALKDENDYLAELIHKDNKMIPSITQAILESHENKTPLNLSEWETDSTLYQKLKQLYDERVDALKTHEEKLHDFPHTCFETVNGTLSYMKTEAQRAGIPFQIVLFDTLESTIPQVITEDDFNHILSDLLANAIHACVDVPSASIQVYLGKMEGIPAIKVCNTEKLFNMKILNVLGLSRHTTHADTGGSGIGLMSIWRLKQKYKATLLIEDTIDTDTASASTCMNILFNRKNHYMIQSNRHKELATYINRPDVIIISKD